MTPSALAEATSERLQAGGPVGRRAVTAGDAAEAQREGYRCVGRLMSTGLFIVRPDDPVGLAAAVMDSRHIRHLLVEDGGGRLSGVVSDRDVLRLLWREGAEAAYTTAVRDIMKVDPVTVSPTTPALEAVGLMRARGVGCLPVVEGGVLVGIVTTHDLLNASTRLFEERLRKESESDGRGPTQMQHC